MHGLIRTNARLSEHVLLGLHEIGRSGEMVLYAARGVGVFSSKVTGRASRSRRVAPGWIWKTLATRHVPAQRLRHARGKRRGRRFAGLGTAASPL